MDSFYDAPRRAPIPTQIEKFHPAPAVPEVSIICAPKPFANKYCWKMQQDGIESVGNLTSKGDNLLKERKTMNSYQNSSIQNTSQILKKQVRFESPILQQRPSLTYEPFNTKQGVTQENVGNAPIVTTKCSKTDEVTNLQQRENRFLAGRTFQELHLANVPNRHLDLSLIDLPKKTKRKIISSEENTKDTGSCKINLNKIQHNEQKESLHNDKENMLPKTYREFLETQKKIRENEKANGSITDILNYKRKEFYSESRTDKISRDLINEPNLTNSKDFKCEPRLMSRDYTSKPNLTESKALTVEPNRMKSIESDVKITSNLINTHISKYNYSGDSKFHTDNQPMQMPLLENKMYSDFRRQNIECYETTGQPQKCDRIIQTSIADVSTSKPDTSLKRVETAKDDTEPTNRDLLKIIAQQNEQLLILQKQVAMLLNKEDQQNHKRIEAAHCYEQNYVGEKCVTSTQNEIFRSPLQDVHNTPRKQPLSKFSIDLMTSFEVAIRPQHIKQNFINQEPKIQEITESESIKDNMSAVDKNDKTLVDASIHLQEPVKVREMCPSPEPSININMNDYDSSDDDEITASEIGATFYRNLMGQVNDILGKAQVQTKADLKDGQNCVDKFKNETMKRVKEATLKHLQNIGVTIRPTEEVDEQMRFVNNNADYSPTEISFAVKQLLMKYLPDDQLAKITFKQTQTVPFNKKTKAGIIPNRPEFSFASVEYMKKYNIISNNTDIKSAENEQVAKIANPQRQDGPKILDITALKMQPKLL